MSVCQSVHAIAAEGGQARACVPCAARPACVSMSGERCRREDRVTIPGFSTCHCCNGLGRVRYNKYRGPPGPSVCAVHSMAGMRKHGRRGATAPSV